VKIVRPVPPTISIKVNGEAITLPAHPVRSTNANGITGYDLYQATYAVPADVTAVPQVAATASDASVKVNIKQAEARTGTAEVKFDYKGVVKTYRVVFTSS
jgi:arabinoxylan arabinofuranohydrolase